MKIQTLEYFITLSECKSINEAARQLFIAQSALTKSMQLLEEEIGVTLFTRSKKGIELTPDGKTVLSEARIMVDYYHGWKNLKKQPHLERVEIYANKSVSGFIVPDLMVQYRNLYPYLSIKYHTSSSPEKYITRSVDNPVMVLSVLGINQKKDYEDMVRCQGNQPIVLMRGYYGCLVNKDNPLAKKESISYHDLKDMYFAIPEMETGNVFSSLSFFSNNDTVLSSSVSKIIETIGERNVITVGAVEMVIEMVRKRKDMFALSFSPTHLRYPAVQTGEVVILPFDDVDTIGQLCLFYSENACQHYSELKKLVQSISEYSTSFIQNCKG